MPTTTHKKKDRTHLKPEIQDARNIMRRRGWTQGEIASELGVTRTHLCLVLNGKRSSSRVLSAIMALPDNPNPA